MVYLPLFNLTMPANVNAVMTILISVATFDMIPMVDEINGALFSFEHTEDEIDHPGYQQLEFETSNFINNAGSLWIYITVFIL